MAGYKTTRYEEVVKALRDFGWWDHRAAIWITEGGYDLGAFPGPAPNEGEQAEVIDFGWDKFQALSNYYESRNELGRCYSFGQHQISTGGGNIPNVYSLRRSDGSQRPAYDVWRLKPGNSAW